MRWEFLLIRKTKNRLNKEITRRRLKEIAESASRNKTLGFEAKVGHLNEPTLIMDEKLGEVYQYVVRFRLSKPVVRNEKTIVQKLEHILEVVKRCAGQFEFEVKPCKTSHEPGSRDDGNVLVSEAPDSSSYEPPPPFVLPPLTDEVMSSFFGDIYERREQIIQLYSAIQTTVETGGEELSHVLLYGLPGSCKSKLARAFQTWFNYGLPEDVEYVKEVDGTTLSKAGLENWLLELADAPAAPVMLFIDELEKQDPSNLFCLHNVMGSGIIAKCNARVGNKRRSLKFTLVGTCNDEEKLKTRAEALWSRFSHQVYCPRPSRELCERILMDTLRRFPLGKPEWVKAVLEFAWDELGQRDVRTIKAHLDGRDRLLDGSWQEGKRIILAAEKKEKAEMVKN